MVLFIIVLLFIIVFNKQEIRTIVPQSANDGKIPEVSVVTDSAYDLGIHNKPIEATKAEPLKLKEKIDTLLHSKTGEYSIGYKSLIKDAEFVINPNSMYAASVIKIFVMAAAYHQANNNEISLDEKLLLNDEDKVGGTGSLSSREAGTEITIRQLIEVMITESDNTATNMLIDKLSFDKINKFIIAQGCNGTILQRKMMDQDSIDKRIENLTSVKDLILILDKLYHGECVSPEYDDEMLGIMKKQKDRSRIPALLPDDTVVANKTGDLSRVVNDTGIVYTDEGDFIICVLSKEITNPSATKETIAKIAEILYNEQ
ncbi:MAG: class A beta-lactamase-related serine hydrolase [Eubacteriales bacterium]|nr:class A beta-lactamase-related serine hydrolase [Eubacteriales bacterium]